ncbi:MAG: transposase, partial [Flavobacteriaceae bacterium]|nr:transposase [Flavobacteriaceae bacterium]
MSEQRTNSHTVSRLTVHIVWSTKYRYKVLTGDIQ